MYFVLFFTQCNPTTDPESPIPSFIPRQGPFHVSLNAEESTVLLFHPLFEKLYKALFGRNKVHEIHIIYSIPIAQRKNSFEYCNKRLRFYTMQLKGEGQDLTTVRE